MLKYMLSQYSSFLLRGKIRFYTFLVQSHLSPYIPLDTFQLYSFLALLQHKYTFPVVFKLKCIHLSGPKWLQSSGVYQTSGSESPPDYMLLVQPLPNFGSLKALMDTAQFVRVHQNSLFLRKLSVVFLVLRPGKETSISVYQYMYSTL